MTMENVHDAVLRKEVLLGLKAGPGKVHADCTLNGATHGEDYLTESSPDGRLIGIDMDGTTLDLARERLRAFGDRLTLVHANFADLTQALGSVGVTKVDSILADLGLSSNQLDRGERGFSFRKEGPLDMRLDPSRGETAADLLARLPEQELARTIRDYGEERFAARIAAHICRARQNCALTATTQLADIVSQAIPRRFHPPNIHPATRTFQALRIAVNGELDSLRRLLEQIPDLLNPGGRVAIISYHSLEDRLVRHAFIDWERDCSCPPKLPVCCCNTRRKARVLTRKPITATDDEIARNPRARSAKLRLAERI